MTALSRVNAVVLRCHDLRKVVQVALHRAGKRLGEQGFLGVEVVVDQPGTDTHRGCDVGHPGRRDAPLRNLVHHRVDDLVTTEQDVLSCHGRQSIGSDLDIDAIPHARVHIELID